MIVPGDIAAAEVEHEMIRRPLITQRPVIRPADADLDRAASMISAAERIVIFGGFGTRDARAEVLELADKLKAPVGYAYRGKDVLEADNPHAVGMTGLLGWGGVTEALQHCDLVLMLGTDFFYHAFLPEIATEGEWSLIFLGGVFSHAVLKRPAADGFLVQREHGGTSVPADPPPRLVDDAALALGAAPGRTLYARVDGVRRGDRLVLLELELLEPDLFFRFGPAAPERFAEVLLSP